MPSGSGNIVFRDATPADVDSMTTMVPRAFNPEAFLLQMIPDTPLVREWWAKTYRFALTDSASRILVAVDSDKTVGILTLHYLDLDSPPSGSAGLIIAVPLTPDHSLLLAAAFDDTKAERKEIMGNDPHFLIELVGVDDGYKGSGIGRKLTAWACEIADEKDAAIFLQTSAASNWYTKKLGLGFEEMKREESGKAGGTVVRLRKSTRETITHNNG